MREMELFIPCFSLDKKQTKIFMDKSSNTQPLWRKRNTQIISLSFFIV